jgi:hypothetical protein
VLRHTSPTTALQKGISLAAIQNILGHDRLTTTAICLIIGTLARKIKMEFFRLKQFAEPCRPSELRLFHGLSIAVRWKVAR